MNKLIKNTLLVATGVVMLISGPILTEAAERGNNMDRVKVAEERMTKIYDGHKSVVSETNPEFDNALHYFLMGDVYSQGNLSDKQRLMITIATITTKGKGQGVAGHVKAALKAGLTPVEITEIFHQLAPYIGFPDALQGLASANKVFVEQGIKLPLASQSTTDESTRFAKGLQAQYDIFGQDTIDTMRAAAPQDLQHLQEYLSAFCFGDTLTRKGLELKDRELITMVALATLGGCEPQLKGHMEGNLRVGNDRTTMLSALTQCIPFIGFPKTLNAVACLNAVAPAKK